MQEVGINGDRQSVCQCVTWQCYQLLCMFNPLHFREKKNTLKQIVLITCSVDLEGLAF